MWDSAEPTTFDSHATNGSSGFSGGFSNGAGAAPAAGFGGFSNGMGGAAQANGASSSDTIFSAPLPPPVKAMPPAAPSAEMEIDA